MVFKPRPGQQTYNQMCPVCQNHTGMGSPKELLGPVRRRGCPNLSEAAGLGKL